MRVVKQREDSIVRRVLLLDDDGDEVVPVNRFLSHLGDAGYSRTRFAPTATTCGTSLCSWTATSDPTSRSLARPRTLSHRLDPQAVSWLQTSFFKTELELAHCLRTPAEGPYECHLVLTCSKFLTTSDYARAFALASRSRSSSSRTPPPP